MSQQILPPPALSYAFDSLAKVFFQRMGQSADQSRTLTELRDTLLPKLISGEVRITGI